MSPLKFHDDDHERSRREIHGPRPSPLKINKDSHIIHKSSSSFLSSSSNSSSSTVFSGVAHHGTNKQQQQQQRQPVIIYTHSPKVIHTQARDFMALVQKLTGFSRSDDHETAPPKEAKKTMNKNRISVGDHHDNESLSSVLTDEKPGSDFLVTSSSVSPIMNPPTNPRLADVPLFTPTSNDNFFCSPRTMFRFPDYASPNMVNSMSPSLFEFIKELPEC